MNTEDLLNERGTTHGDFTDNARVSQELKKTIHCENADLIDIEKEAIDMICHKLARIVCGDPHFKDHWDDITGYAKLVSDRL